MQVLRLAAFFMWIVWCPALTEGTTSYYVSMLGRNSSTISQQNEPLYLFVNNQNSDNIIITITGSNCGNLGNRSIPSSVSRDPETVILNCSGLIPTGIEVASKGLKITSDSEFLLQVVQVDNSLPTVSREGYLAFKTDHLGNEYYVVTYCQTGGWCQFSVLATEDTSINIRFPSNVTAQASCVTGSGGSDYVLTGTSVPFYLSALDVLHIESEQDLSGTYISSDNVIAVYSGARDVPASNDSKVSHFIEQLLPTNKWGTEFIVMPNDANDNGDLINIVTKSNNTTVEILGFSPFIIPYAGDSVIRRIDWGMYTYIWTDKPVEIAQFLFINLYNNTQFSEMPSMVLVQAKNQWADENYFYAHPAFSTNGTQVQVAAASTNDNLKIEGIEPTSNSADFFSPTIASIERIGAKAHSTDINGFSRLKDGEAAAYGFIANNIAMLGNIVTEDNEDCQIFFGYPGDRMDNDCDDMVDEDICTLADIETSFHLPYDSSNVSAPIYTEVLDIGRSDNFNFKVITCGLLQISLRSTINPSLFAALQVSQTHILMETCNPNCYQDEDISVTGITDCTTTPIVFSVSLGTSMTVSFGATTKSVPITGLQVDRLLFMSLVRESNVTIDITDKDCGKIISGEEDNYGKTFVIPIKENGGTVSDIFLFVTNKGSTNANVQVYPGFDPTEIHFMTVSANDSVTLDGTNLNSYSSYDLLILRSSEEVSVQFMYRTDSKTTALMLLPTDILGPYYHYHLQNDSSEYRNFMTPVVQNKAVKLKADMTNLVNKNEVNFGQTPSGTLVEAHMPFAMFFGHKELAFTQVPPKETLGKHFYIPAIDLDQIVAEAEICIITTEDSTYFKILGEYHQEYIRDFRGANLQKRSLYPNELFEIEANKPIQVMLEIKAQNGSWGSLLVIPHIAQYRSLSVIPKLDPGFTVTHSTGVQDDGTATTRTFTSGDPMPQTAAERMHSESRPFYQLLFVQDSTATQNFVLQSDLKFDSNSNKLCSLTPVSPGDNLDNDCDNLVDEETCVDSGIVPGEIDPDIDGDINDDCKNNTSAYVNTAPMLALSSNTTTCPASTPVTTQSTPTLTPAPTNQPSVVVHNTLSADWFSNIVYPPVPAGSAPPTFEPVGSTPTSTAATPTTASTQTSATQGTTAVPEETCTTDCVCPCGWVTEKNYTQEELKEVIVEIQEKLKVEKNKLSSVQRKKTSAPDDRPSATAVGYVGFTFLIITIGSITLLDVTSIIRDLRMLRTNLQEVFNI